MRMRLTGSAGNTTFAPGSRLAASTARQFGRADDAQDASTLGDAGINVATFHVGRDAPGGNAVALIEIAGELPRDVLARVRALPQVQQAKPLRF